MQYFNENFMKYFSTFLHENWITSLSALRAVLLILTARRGNSWSINLIHKIWVVHITINKINRCLFKNKLQSFLVSQYIKFILKITPNTFVTSKSLLCRTIHSYLHILLKLYSKKFLKLKTYITKIKYLKHICHLKKKKLPI